MTLDHLQWTVIAVLSLMTLTNALKDVAGKYVLAGGEIFGVTFWIRVFAFLTVVVYAATQWRSLSGPIHSGTGWGVMAPLHLGAYGEFVLVLAVDVLCIACAALTYYRALQLAPLSLTAPFLAFTPVLLVPMGWLVLHERPTVGKLLGSLLVVVGSMLMYSEAFALGPLAPLRAVLREPGSRLSLLTAAIFSLTNPLDKKLVLMSSPLFHALAYGAGLVIVFAVLCTFRRSPVASVIRANAPGLALAGCVDGLALLSLFAAYHYADIVFTISLKRTGVVLSVLFGWLLFQERDVLRRLSGAGVMLLGVLTLYAPDGSTLAWGFFAAGIIVAALVITSVTRGKVHLRDAY